jgi:hypothetical protein
VTCAAGAGTMTALTVSPHLRSGTATSATSATAGWLRSRVSTSIEVTFSPPVMMTSF